MFVASLGGGGSFLPQTGEYDDDWFDFSVLFVGSL
jgi:hypothetical protein